MMTRRPSTVRTRTSVYRTVQLLSARVRGEDLGACDSDHASRPLVGVIPITREWNKKTNPGPLQGHGSCKRQIELA